jgi:hypothetical protein
MKTFMAVAFAVAFVSSQAQAAFQIGWNKIYISNCFTFADAKRDVLWIFPDISRTAGLTPNDTLATADLIYITTLSPFCKSGAPFYVQITNIGPAMWNAISVYPGLK